MIIAILLCAAQGRASQSQSGGGLNVVGDVVSLKRARKQRAREQASQRATENRARYGRSKDERKRGAELQAKLSRELDRHRLEKEAE